MVKQYRRNEPKMNLKVDKLVVCPKCEKEVPESAMISFNLKIQDKSIVITKCYWCAT